MSTTRKQELVDRGTAYTQTTQTRTKAIVNSILDEIITELGKNNRLEFRDFGVFETRIQAARRAQNPKTMEQIQVPTKRVVKFKMGRLMKEKMNSQNAKL